jgi:hypothetical protein
LPLDTHRPEPSPRSRWPVGVAQKTKLRGTTRAASRRAVNRHAPQRPAWGARGARLARCAKGRSWLAFKLLLRFIHLGSEGPGTQAPAQTVGVGVMRATTAGHGGRRHRRPRRVCRRRSTGGSRRHAPQATLRRMASCRPRADRGWRRRGSRRRRGTRGRTRNASSRGRGRETAA